MIVICDYMKWDYYTYIKQPVWFIESLRAKIKLDNYGNRNKIKSSDRRTG